MKTLVPKGMTLIPQVSPPGDDSSVEGEIMLHSMGAGCHPRSWAPEAGVCLRPPGLTLLLVGGYQGPGLVPSPNSHG